MRSSQKTKWTDEEGAKKRIQMVGHRIYSQDRAPPQNTVIQGPEKENPNFLMTPLAPSHFLMKIELENCKKEKKKCSGATNPGNVPYPAEGTTKATDTHMHTLFHLSTSATGTFQHLRIIFPRPGTRSCSYLHPSLYSI